MYKKTCTGCGTEFETDNFRKRKCKKDCGRADTHIARTKKNAEHNIQFVAVDGEGVNVPRYRTEWIDTEDGFVEEIQVPYLSHEYVMLSVGNKTLHKSGKELTHEDIFPFLYEQFLLNPDAAFVGFFLGYDFTQWLKTLTEYEGWALLTKDGIARRMPRMEEARFPYPVRTDEWEFDILGMKRFKLRPRVDYDKRPTVVTNHLDGTMSEKKVHPYKWMFVCDAGSFFQTSFMNAINPSAWSDPVVSQSEYELLQAGKADRSTAHFGPQMMRYNVLENEVLSRLMSRLNKGFVTDDVRLRKDKWFGPGQAAQAWMKNIGCPTGEEIREVVPQYALDAARKSYYGGWFEIFAHGVVPGTTYAYDINSAYPTAIKDLPCLLHGEWSTGNGKPGRLRNREIRLVRARVHGRDSMPFGGLPHRNADGAVLHPLNTQGWHWESEIQAAKRAGVVQRIEILEWVSYLPCNCPPPLRSIEALYQGRLDVGKNSPEGKAKKLLYNSSYGKLAQSVGMPRFSNSIWASLITSACRSMILDAIATHPNGPNDVVMIATDSVTFYTPHPTLELDESKLGAWDATEHNNLSLLMPGLYWDDTSRQRIREGKTPKIKSRGVPARDLAQFIDEYDKLWSEMTQNDLETDTWPRVQIPIGFAMLGAKLAAHQGNWHKCGEVNYEESKSLSASPLSKRQIGHFDNETRPGHRLIRTMPYHADFGGVETVYYDKLFGEVSVSEIVEASELLTPDGTAADVIRQIIPQ